MINLLYAEGARCLFPIVPAYMHNSLQSKLGIHKIIFIDDWERVREIPCTERVLGCSFSDEESDAETSVDLEDRDSSLKS